MKIIDPITEALMAQGAPFEVVEDGEIRVFKNAPASMTSLLDSARQFGEADFIVHNERRMTFAQFFERADALAAYLQSERHIKSGDAVGICMKNCAEWMISFVAILGAGGVAILVNSRGTGDDISRALDDAKCKLVIIDDSCRRRVDQVKCKVPRLDVEDIVGLASARPKQPNRGGRDIAAMFFTSGTTGRAKAAMTSHRNLVTGTMNTRLMMATVFTKMAQEHGLDLDSLKQHMPQSASLLIFPLFHTSGCSAVFLTALLNGGKLVLMDRWRADAALDLIAKEKITVLSGVPTMFWDILQCPDLQERDLSSLVSLSVGGQALPQNLLQAIREAFPKAFIGTGYGMTETSGAISQAAGDTFLKNPRASGQILPMMDVRIVNDYGQDLAAGEAGEIWVKGATLMEGYFGDERLTSEKMEGPWFKTGDMGIIDGGGYLTIVDRKTDMVISGGENIYCAEVEQVLGQHPNIAQIAAFGVPDDRLGERLIACLYLNSDIELSNIKDFAAANLAKYRIPAEFILSSTALPLNVLGKIDKVAVRKAYLIQ